MNWIFLSLLAPFFWAASNLFDKYALDKVSRGVYDFLFFGTIGGTIVFIFSYLVFGIEQIIPQALFAIASGFLLNYDYLFYSRALRKEDASHIVPLYISYSVIVLILNFFIFEEAISKLQFIAFVIILFGAFTLSIQSIKLRSLKYRKGALWMIPAIILIAVSFILFNQSIKYLSFTDAFMYDLLGFSLAGLSFLIVPTWRREIFDGIKRATTRKFQLFLMNDAIDLSGQLAYKYALVLTPAASLVAVIGGIQPFYVLIFGVLLTLFFPRILKEDVSKRVLLQKIIGALIIVVGISILHIYGET
jgi:uncharacterized membrane protein